MKKERLQAETDRGSHAYSHKATVGFVVAEYALPAKFPPPVNRMVEKSHEVILYAESVKRQPDQ